MSESLSIYEKVKRKLPKATLSILGGPDNLLKYIEDESERPVVFNIADKAQDIRSAAAYHEADLAEAWNLGGVAAEAAFANIAYKAAAANHLRTLSGLNRMVEMINNGHEEYVDQAEFDFLVNEAKKHDDELYGTISPEALHENVQFMVGESQNDSKIPEISLLIEEIGTLLDANMLESVKSGKEKVGAAGDWVPLIGFVQEKYSEIYSTIDDDKEYELAGMVEIFQRALELEGFEGWKVETEPNNSNVTVYAKSKKVKLGEDLKPKKGSWIKGSLAHELYHARTFFLAQSETEYSDAMLYGQDSYLAFEEGVAVILEDLAQGKSPEPHGTEFNVAIGLAKGVDGLDERNLDGVYAVLWRLELFGKLRGKANGIQTNELTLEEMTSDAKRKSVLKCRRVFRGTTGTVPGLTWSKDLVYGAKSGPAKEYMLGICTKEDFDKLHREPKLDLTDPRHLEYRNAA
jgi:hypothetical protein